MTSTEFRDRLASRAGRAGVTISDHIQDQLETYFRLLAKWNAKVNLTALPMHQPTDETFDRLLVEPLVASQYVADSTGVWFDVGSGGGSPAIPLKIVRPHGGLTMIESRARRAAFLRESVRTLGLSETIVQNDRFESVAKATKPHSVDLVTVRAVELNRVLLNHIHRLLSHGGQTFLFHSPRRNFSNLDKFALVRAISLGTATGSKLSILSPVFHVEQNG